MADRIKNEELERWCGFLRDSAILAGIPESYVKTWHIERRHGYGNPYTVRVAACDGRHDVLPNWNAYMKPAELLKAMQSAVCVLDMANADALDRNRLEVRGNEHAEREARYAARIAERKAQQEAK